MEQRLEKQMTGQQKDLKLEQCVSKETVCNQLRRTSYKCYGDKSLGKNVLRAIVSRTAFGGIVGGWVGSEKGIRRQRTAYLKKTFENSCGGLATNAIVTKLG